MTSPAPDSRSKNDQRSEGSASSSPRLSVVDTNVDPDFSTRAPRKGITVVGINPGGFGDLSASAQQAILEAEIIIGSSRQLDLIPAELESERITWPTPLVPAIPKLLAPRDSQAIVVLGSGDPMFYGIGSTLATVIGPESFNVIPAPSSAALACAELKWPAHSTAVVSLVTAEPESIVPVLDRCEPFLILGKNRSTPQEVARVLLEQGQSEAEVTVLSDLGGAYATIATSKASDVAEPESSLNVIAVKPSEHHTRMLVPGLPDGEYDHDGQLTKQHIRALTVSTLEPTPGKLLWDIGGGAGSIAIEYLRSTPSTRAVCFEQSELRRARIRHNASMLGTPDLEIAGSFPCERNDRPDIVFVGGGLTAEGVFDAAWTALVDGGLFISNAVTMESQACIMELRQRFGGTITRFEVSTEHSVGSFTSLRPALAVWQWKTRKHS